MMKSPRGVIPLTTGLCLLIVLLIAVETDAMSPFTMNCWNAFRRANNSVSSIQQGDEIIDRRLCSDMIKAEWEATKSGRKKRHIINRNYLANQIWSIFPIRYVFSPSIADQHRALIRGAISHVEANTCVSFKEGPPPSPDDSYIRFTNGSSCLAHIGKSSITIPQDISLTSICSYQFGPTVHLILQTLGMLHPEQRPDRDNFVNVKTDNIKDNELGNFQKLMRITIETFDYEYDHGSIMHYPRFAFSIDGSSTLEPTDPRKRSMIGQRTGMSFYDAKIINSQYCSERCAGSQLQCVGISYPDPDNCSICKCPDGFTGDLCEDYDFGSGASECGEELIHLSSTYLTIKSPRHGNPSGDHYIPYEHCTWVLLAAQGSTHIELQFVEDFAVFSVDESCYHFVEFRYSNDLQTPDQRFCGTDVSREVMNIASNKMMILFRSNFSYGLNNPDERKGFKLRIRAVGADWCDSHLCENGGTCDSEQEACLCTADYRGTLCKYHVCGSSNACSVHGTCRVDPSIARKYSCDCELGYAGTNCERDLCDNVTCRNGGTLTRRDRTCSCSCRAGYAGRYCEIDVCSSSPCLNGGTCSVRSSGYTCQCLPGYTGSRCEPNPCSSSPCRNLGTCLVNGSGFSCVCRRGFFGALCQIDINECASEPCLNGGECMDEIDGYTCVCREGFTGIHCETGSSSCTPNPCRNGGTCLVDGNGSVRCQCPPPFNGSHCEEACCGGCGKPGPSLAFACDRVAQPPRQCSYTVTTIWWRTRTEHRPCLEYFCCDNAHLVEMVDSRRSGVTRHYCAVEGYSEWCGCSWWCGACGTQRRIRYFLDRRQVAGSSRQFLNREVEYQPCGFTPCRSRPRCCDGYHELSGACVQDN